MEYTLLSKAQRDQIVRGFLVSAEADNFRETLNLSNLNAMKADAERLDEQKKTVRRTEAMVANMVQQAADMGVDLTPEIGPGEMPAVTPADVPVDPAV